MEQTGEIPEKTEYSWGKISDELPDVSRNWSMVGLGGGRSWGLSVLGVVGPWCRRSGEWSVLGVVRGWGESISQNGPENDQEVNENSLKMALQFRYESHPPKNF